MFCTDSRNPRYRVILDANGLLGIEEAGTGARTPGFTADFHFAERLALLFTADRLSPVHLTEAVRENLRLTGFLPH